MGSWTQKCRYLDRFNLSSVLICIHSKRSAMVTLSPQVISVNLVSVSQQFLKYLCIAISLVYFFIQVNGHRSPCGRIG